MRIGFGFDSHALKPGLPLKIGGVSIPFEKGALGHSDADVLIHSICDAMLGAMALGDIGHHFPDTDPAYKGIDSTKLLDECVKLMVREHYDIENLDCTICIEQPKMAPHIEKMRDHLSAVLGIPVGDISIKAKTSEKMGFIGRGEGVSAYTVILLR
jgi:2-C-methyl-D-erythritol 2,4-cyclodiphosphate synthase